MYLLLFSMVHTVIGQKGENLKYLVMVMVETYLKNGQKKV